MSGSEASRATADHGDIPVRLGHHDRESSQANVLGGQR
jgi:hypothetical protein